MKGAKQVTKGEEEKWRREKVKEMTSYEGFKG